MLGAIIVSVVIITSGEAWNCEGPEVFIKGTCEEPQEEWAGVSYDTAAASYIDDGTCFDVPEWCWADGKDTL